MRPKAAQERLVLQTARLFTSFVIPCPDRIGRNGHSGSAESRSWPFQIKQRIEDRRSMYRDLDYPAYCALSNYLEKESSNLEGAVPTASFTCPLPLGRANCHSSKSPALLNFSLQVLLPEYVHE